VKKRILIISLLLFVGYGLPLAEKMPSKAITIDFKDADINDVLRTLALQQEINIVTDEPIKGRVAI